MLTLFFFGIDEQAFKTPEEKRVDRRARQRQEEVEAAKYYQQLYQKEEVVDAKLEKQALNVTGAERPLAPPEPASAPSGEASGLKGQILRP